MRTRKITKHLPATMLALILYLIVSLLYFGTARNYSHRYLGIGPGPTAYIWSLNWWPWAITHGLNPFVSYYIWYPQGFNMTWATSVPAAAMLMLPLTWLTNPTVSFNVLSERKGIAPQALTSRFREPPARQAAWVSAMKMTIGEGRMYLRNRHPPMGKIVDELEARGLRLDRFTQTLQDGVTTCSLKFSGLADDYLLAFSLKPGCVLLARCDGQGGISPIQLDEFSGPASGEKTLPDQLLKQDVRRDPGVSGPGRRFPLQQPLVNQLWEHDLQPPVASGSCGSPYRF
jgi:hypothetical protein